MRKDFPRYTLRITREMLDKVGFIAEFNGRTKNKEIEYIIKKYINEYERMYGMIKTDKIYED
jgi:predicted DNA-binding protein